MPELYLLRRAGRRKIFSGVACWLAVLGATSSPAQTPPADSDLGSYKQLSLEELMQVEVTSVSKQPEPYADAPAAIDVITSDEIEQSGAALLPETLRLADNLDVAQKSAVDWDVSARGFDSNTANKLLVLFDGRSVYTPLFSGVFWNLEDYVLADVDRIEVISGPGGTLWGANAVNGVINITTKSAQDTQGLYVQGGGGNELEELYNVRYGGTLAPNVYYRVYAKYYDFGDDPLEGGGDATDAASGAREGFRLDASPSPDDTLTLEGDATSTHEELESGGDARLADGDLEGRWTRAFSDDASLSLQLYWDLTHIYDPFPASQYGPLGYLEDDLNTYDADLQYSFHLGSRQQIVSGLGYRYIDDNVGQEAPNFSFLPRHQPQDLYNVYAQDEIEIWRNLHFTAGSKVEHNYYTGFEYEPSARLKWDAAPGHMVWLAVSRAVRTPSRFDTDLAEPSPPQAQLIGPDHNYVSETLVAYEAGYRAQVTPDADLSASVFFNDYDRLESLGVTPVTFFPLNYQNDDAGHTWGAELGGDYQIASWWRFHAGYDFLKEHLWVKPGGFDAYDTLDLTADPENQVSLRSSMDLPYRIGFAVMYRWVAALPTNNGLSPATTPPYDELDLHLSWRPTRRLELSVVGENLLKPAHLEFGAPGPTAVEIRRGVYGEGTFRY